VHDERKAVGLVPLVQRGGVIEFLGSPDSDYNDLLCESGAAVPVLETALEYLRQSPLAGESISLEKISEQSKIVRGMESLPAGLRRHLQLVFLCPSPAIVMDQEACTQIDALMEKDQLSRYHKKLKKMGRVEFRHFASRDEARSHLDRFFHQHITRWAMSNERSQFLDAKSKAFYLALVEELDPGKELRFGVLELDSKPIAYHFGFEHNGTLTWYKPTFDVNYWDYCPGQVILRSILRHAKLSAMDEVDFTLGDEPYKYRFANRVRNNYTLHLERQPHAIASLCRSAVRSAEHIVRQRPELKAALKEKMLRAKGVAVRLRGMFHRDSALKACRNGLRRVGGFVWSFDEALLWSGTISTGGAPSGVLIAPGGLDDLVSLSVEYGCFLNSAQLHDYRRKIKQGDLLFIARNSKGEAYVLWLGQRNEIEVSRRRPEIRFQLSEPVLVINECWRVPHPSVQYVPGDVLKAFGAHLAGRQLWICHAGEQRWLKDAAEAANMGFRHRWSRHTFLGLYGYSQSQSPPGQSDLLGKQVVTGVIRASP
jgi:CelD/BcsL family acetyltransferase involved in cellulose biosynthesis